MNYSKLPEEVKQSGRFCCWRLEDRGGRGTKIPYNPVTGQWARSNDPGSFAAFDVTMMETERGNYSGIGIGMFNGICAIDLDDCVTDSGFYTETAAQIIELMHSYTETSPSGNGVHILFRADGFRYDVGRYYIMNHPRRIEVYVAGATSKYVTVTGQRVNEYPFGERSKELSELLERYMTRSDAVAGVPFEGGQQAVPIGEGKQGQPCGRNGVNGRNPQYGGNTNGASYLQDDELLQKAQSCRNGESFRRLWEGDCSGYPSQSEADMALCRQLAFWTGRDAQQMDRLFRRSGLMREKWDRPQCGSTYGAITIQNAIKGCSKVYTPTQKNTNATTQSVNQFAAITPLQPEKSSLPEFPVDCLPQIIGEYVRAVSEHSQTAPDMAAVIALGVLSVCLQGKFLVQGTPGYYEPLSLYVVVVAPPGERKSGVMRDMTGCLYQYEREFNEARAPEVQENQHKREELERKIRGLERKLEQSGDEELELELRDLKYQLEDTPELKPARFFADDCSSEALTSLLAQNGGCFAVISTEGGIFDIMAGRYSSKSNLDVWLKGHCGDAIRVDRLGREPEYIPNPALSAILTIQPSVLDNIMSNDEMIGRGLLARFLYSNPPSRIGQRVFCAPPIPAETAAAYRKLVFALMDIPREEPSLLLTLSDRATEVISDYFRTHERFLVEEGQMISDWASKYIGAVLRIAGLLHVADADPGDWVIQPETMCRAIGIGCYFLAHSNYAYSMMGTDLGVKKASYVLTKLKKNKVQEVKRSELLRMCRGKFFKKVEDILPTLELLEGHHYIRLEEQVRTTPGRPPDVVVKVNPAAFAGEAAT